MTLQGSIALSSILHLCVWPTGGPLFLWERTPCVPPVSVVLGEATPAIHVHCVDAPQVTQEDTEKHACRSQDKAADVAQSLSQLRELQHSRPLVLHYLLEFAQTHVR